MSCINIHKLLFAFANNRIFTDFSCEMNMGEIITIVGNSGCGKSTLLNLIVGLLKPSSGEISVNGSFSFLTQHLTLLPYYNAFENSLLACELRGERTKAAEDTAGLLFDLFKLSESARYKFPRELSGGMKQRVGLIQSLIVDADIYLLDEPFKEIDRATGLIIQNYLWKKFRTNHNTAIIVTHDIEQAVLVSDRILFLSPNKPARELCFNDEFCALPPEKRLMSGYYDEYMLTTIKTLGEL